MILKKLDIQFTVEVKDSSVEKKVFSKGWREHSGRMGSGLARDILDRFSKPEDSIYDPMAGIFTTALVVGPEQKFVGVELSQRWSELAEKALANRTNVRVIQGDAREVASSVLGNVDLMFLSPTFPGAHSPGKAERQVELIDTLKSYPGTDYGDDPANMGNHTKEEEWIPFLSDILRPGFDAMVPGGLALVHIKNHVRSNEEVRCDLWVKKALESVGFEVEGYCTIQLKYTSWLQVRHLYPLRKIKEWDGWVAHMDCTHSKTYNPKRTAVKPNSGICKACGPIPDRVKVEEERLVVARKPASL